MPQFAIAEVMTRVVETASPGEELRDVAIRMSRRRLSCLVVCEKERPVGIVSERDLVGLAASLLSGECLPASVGEIMTHHPVTVGISEKVSGAVHCAQAHGIRRLVVVDETGRVAGVVTQTDLLRAHAVEIERQRSSLEYTVAARTQELAEANRRLEDLALLDPLLGIGNRRAMEHALDRAHARAERYRRPYAVALFDVDCFKAYNDGYGHPEGDDALRRVSRALVEASRRADAIYRYGGEEILMLLPETTVEGAFRAAERGRRAVEALNIPHCAEGSGCLTVSAGVTVSHAADRPLPATWRAVLALADRGLYAAKDAGRNRIAAALGMSTPA